jgi:hypothetical protein
MKQLTDREFYDQSYMLYYVGNDSTGVTGLVLEVGRDFIGTRCALRFLRNSICFDSN